jgi:hypothetical protein
MHKIDQNVRILHRANTSAREVRRWCRRCRCCRRRRCRVRGRCLCWRCACATRWARHFPVCTRHASTTRLLELDATVEHLLPAKRTWKHGRHGVHVRKHCRRRAHVAKGTPSVPVAMATHTYRQTYNSIQKITRQTETTASVPLGALAKLHEAWLLRVARANGSLFEQGVQTKQLRPCTAKVTG